MSVLPTCMSVYHMHVLCLWRPEVFGCPGTKSGTKWWQVAMCVLGTKPGSSARAAGDLIH